MPVREINITASLMCADQTRLLEEVIHLEEAGVDGFHIDVMDGHFVPNLALNIDVIKPLKKVTQKPFDVHMMVEYPQTFIERIIDTGVEKITFHFESKYDLETISSLFDKYECELGIAINPATSLKRLPLDIFDIIGHVLIMTVNPGFAGQRVISSALEKVRSFVLEPRFKTRDIDIVIDGHVNRELINDYWQAGASFFVGGSTGLFCQDFNYKKNIEILKNGYR